MVRALLVLPEAQLQWGCITLGTEDLVWDSYHLGPTSAAVNMLGSLSLSSEGPHPLVNTVCNFGSVVPFVSINASLFLAIQFARVSGFSPIITTSSLIHSDYLHSLGASHVLDRSLSNVELQKRIKEILGSSDLSYALDAVGQCSTTAMALHVLSPGGYLASAEAGTGRVQDSRTIINIYGSLHVPQNREFGKQFISGVAALLGSGDIQVGVPFARMRPL